MLALLGRRIEIEEAVKFYFLTASVLLSHKDLVSRYLYDNKIRYAI